MPVEIDEAIESLAKAFLSQLRKSDAEQVRAIVTDDVVWNFPGKASA